MKSHFVIAALAATSLICTPANAQSAAGAASSSSSSASSAAAAEGGNASITTPLQWVATASATATPGNNTAGCVTTKATGAHVLVVGFSHSSSRIDPVCDGRSAAYAARDLVGGRTGCFTLINTDVRVKRSAEQAGEANCEQQVRVVERIVEKPVEVIRYLPAPAPVAYAPAPAPRKHLVRHRVVKHKPRASCGCSTR